VKFLSISTINCRLAASLSSIKFSSIDKLQVEMKLILVVAAVLAFMSSIEAGGPSLELVHPHPIIPKPLKPKTAQEVACPECPERGLRNCHCSPDRGIHDFENQCCIPE